MSGVDDKIVSMQFNNSDFEAKLSQTLQGLDKLNQSLQNVGTQNGLDHVSAAANNFNTSRMASALDAISSKFSALGVIGATAISKLTSGFMGFASNLINTAKTDVLSPIITGGKQRAQDLQQAKFQFEGLGMDVNAGMASALKAVQGTAYGLNDAAMVAAQFGASGIKAGDDMTKALTGISGIAAMTGRSYGEIGQIFTSMAGQGKVSSMDLMEFGIRGVNAAAAYGKQIGKTEAQVRDMVTHGQVSFKDFAFAMDAAFGKHATDANQTYTGSLSNMHAAMSRMGASFFSDRLVQERDLFNAITPVIDKFTKALLPITTELLKITGTAGKGFIAFLGHINLAPYAKDIQIFVKVMADGFKMVHEWTTIVKTAFRDIIPSKSVAELGEFGNWLDRIAIKLTPTGSAIAKITTVFKGLFAILSIVGTVIHGVFIVVSAFFDAFTGAGAGGTLNTLDSLANAIIKLQKYLVTSGKMLEFFQFLAGYAKVAVVAIKEFIDAASRLISRLVGVGEAAKQPAEAIKKVHEELSKLVGVGNNAQKSLDGLSATSGKLQSVFSSIAHILSLAWGQITTFFSNLGHAIASAITPGTFRTALSGIDVALLGGIALMLRNFFKNGFKFDIGGGFFGQIQSSFEGLTKTMKTMQTELKAKTLMEIAGAVGILAASLVVLSLIKPDALASAMMAMAAGFTELVLVMKQLDKIGGTTGSAKLSMLSAAMVAMSAAVLVLSAAVAVMAALSWTDLSRGLTGITTLLTLLVATAKLMEGSATGMVAAGLAMIPLATGLTILAGTVQIFAHMSWESMLHGMAGLAGTLLIIAAAMKLMDPVGILATGLAMIPLATGITILSGAMKVFGTMSWAEIARGLVALAGALVVIAVAMNLMPLSLPITAAGLVGVAVALSIIAGAMRLFGAMSWGEILKGLTAIAGIMVILAIGVNAMSGALPGAAAMIVVAGALLVLTKVVATLGTLKLGDLIQGLLGMAAVFLVIGVAGLVLAPIIPALLGLGAAMSLMGIGFALFGVGALLVAKAFTEFSEAASAGIKAVVASINFFIQALPTFIATFVTSLFKSAGSVAQATGLMLKMFEVLLGQILDVIIKMAPKVAVALVVLITNALLLLRKVFPDVANTALDLIMVLLTTLVKHLPDIIAAAVTLIVGFANAISNNAPRLIDAAVHIITTFLNAIAARAVDLVTAGLNVLVKLLEGIANNLAKVVGAAGDIVAKFIGALGSNDLKILDAGTTVLAKFITGLGNDAGKLAKAGTDALIKFVTGIGQNVVQIATATGQAILNTLNGIDAAIKKYEPQIIDAGIRIASDLLSGLIQGLDKHTGGLLGKVTDVVSGVIKTANDVAGNHSPSRVFAEFGKNLMLGAAVGINSDKSAEESVVAKATAIVTAFQKSLAGVPDTLAGMGEFNPRITPVLDLSKVQAGAKGIGDLIASSQLIPQVSIVHAGVIATTTDVVGNKPADPLANQDQKQVIFNQTINAPSALSTNDIYRNTSSQIARAKEELNI